MKQALDLSYYDLPYRLKPCFPYLGNFPFGWEFEPREVAHLWIAEGLVSWEDEGSDETLMDVADCYLAELVERSMVQVVSRGVMGRMKTCHLHELMQELCLSKAIEENFLQLVAHRPSNYLCHLKGSSLGIEGELLKKRPRILFGYHHLRKLWVEGRMLGLKNAHMLLENLTMLSLHQTEIKSVPMPVLEKLPCLSHLKLLSKSYIGKEMICSTGGFPSLVNLELSSSNIEDRIVEQGAMPSLVHLKICNYRSLKMIPHGLKYVIGLQQVNIENMPKSF
ncbi:hypothetical protein Ancab_025650 [Ancistrocladus abbreviatus]